MKELITSYHEKQNEIFQHPAKYKVVACGRRFGKTRGCINWVASKMMRKANGLSWWVAPIFKQARIGFKYFIKIFHKFEIIHRINRSELEIELINGHILEFKSADIPDTLRGEGLDNLVIEECGVIKNEVWDEILQPSLLDNPQSEAVFIGTPHGMNWFARIKTLGEDLLEPDYIYFKFSTYDNLFILKEDIDKLRTRMSERAFQQEIMGEFLEDAGGVFHNVDAICIMPASPFRTYNNSHKYYMGVDLGKYLDFTVLIVIDYTVRELVYFERFNQINWDYQIERLITSAKEWNAHIILEVNSVGDIIFDQIKKKYPKIEGFNTNNKSKEDIINNLVNIIEKKTIAMPFISEIVNELKMYQFELTPSRNIKMGAPPGFHDDCVIAMALACMKLDIIPFKPWGIEA